jgi:hypothetical protein
LKIGKELKLLPYSFFEDISAKKRQISITIPHWHRQYMISAVTAFQPFLHFGIGNEKVIRSQGNDMRRGQIQTKPRFKDLNLTISS